MTYFLVTWLATQCPGGPFAGLIPPAARAFLCTARPDYSMVGSRGDATRLVREHGPNSRVYWCKNLKCWERDVKWSQVFEIK